MIEKFEKRPCAWCGNLFVPKTSRNRYCCRACGKKGNAKDTLRHNRDRVRALLGTRKCDNCGKTYEPKRADSKTCSKACRRALSWKQLKKRVASGKASLRMDASKTRTCRLCGTEFVPKHAAQRYCSDDCRIAYTTMAYRATVEMRHNAPTEKKPTVMRRCSYCGKTYMAHSGRSRFCSTECYAMSRAGAEERSREERKATCLVCGKEFIRYTKRNMFCSKKCAKWASYCRTRIEEGHDVPDGKKFMRADDMMAAKAANASARDDVSRRRRGIVYLFGTPGGKLSMIDGMNDEAVAASCAQAAMMSEEAE